MFYTDYNDTIYGNTSTKNWQSDIQGLLQDTNKSHRKMIVLDLKILGYPVKVHHRSTIIHVPSALTVHR